MKTDRRLLLAIVLAGLAIAGWWGLMAWLVWPTLAPRQHEGAAALLGMGGLLAWALAACGLRWLHRRYVRAPARLLEQARLLLAATQAPQMPPTGSPDMDALAGTLQALAAQRDLLRQDVAKQIALASHRVQEEKNRLAALVSELTQSVVVCNLDGRILLYNGRARLQFRALSDSPGLAGGAELVGIGRSIYAVFDRPLVAHALESIYERLERGAASPTAQFVTSTRSGQLLRVQMAPVRAGPAAEGDSGIDEAAPQGAVTGFVLMLDNVTRSFEEESQRDQVLHGLTEGSRAALANIQAALDMLDFEDVAAEMRARFLAVVRDEVARMGQRIDELARRSTQGIKTRWPLEDMLGADLAAAAQRRIESLSQRTVAIDAVDAGLWLKVDSFSLLQALGYLAYRLVEEFGAKYLQLRLQAVAGRAQLDLVWTGHAMGSETVLGWELDPMRWGSESTPLSVRDVVDRHGGEMWFERDRVRQQAFFRFLLPLASAQEQIEAAQLLQHDSRPEFYDFDLFQSSEQSSALDERPLASLAYTVFDTETTGLDPAGGDEIIQIGAVRIVNGKLLRQESFEQLVDPGRLIPEASIPIHGITQAMVSGKPRIAEVLPAFHAFAQDSVLVAHNAAFDMRFLQLQEAATGLVFRQPVLDTLLLSAVLHPQQDAHRLEAIAERFSIPLLGRHTALGDAMVTAEVWLRLLPLLQAMGIHTLGQARAAAQKSLFARLKY